MDKPHNSPPSPQLTYPSQQEGFIPLDFSSPVHRQNKNAQHRHQQTPYFAKTRQNHNRNNYNNNRNTSCQQNNFRNNDNNQFGGYSNQGNNSRGFYQQNNRRNFHNNRGRNSGGHNHQKGNSDISLYIHPSMIEDPWKELLERHNAMKGDDDNDSKDEKSDSNSRSSSTD